MKISKQASKALFVMLIMLSILPGCGKNNNNNGNAVGVAPIVSPIGNGGCATLNGAGGQVITFSGSLNANATGLTAQLPVYNFGSYTGGYGSAYWRVNTSGDRIDVYTSGNSAYVVVQLAAITVQAITGSGYNYGYGNYGYNSQICGLYMNVSIIGPSQYGTIGGGTIAMWNQAGYVRNIATGSVLLL